jgi:hypothetical protein
VRYVALIPSTLLGERDTMNVIQSRHGQNEVSCSEGNNMADDLGAKKADYLAIVSKGTIGAIPIVGPLAAEVIGALIPNQRIERIEALLKALEEKIKEFDKQRLETEFKMPEFIDLLEDGFHQAVRALSKERIDYIATLVSNRLSDEQAEHLKYKKLLSILGQLNDAEVLHLINYSFLEAGDQEFMQKHDNILHPVSAHMGSSQAELDAAAIQDSNKRHLIELGLIRPSFQKTRRGELPEFDDRTGLLKASGNQITPLGRLLVKAIGQGSGM